MGAASCNCWMQIGARPLGRPRTPKRGRTRGAEKSIFAECVTAGWGVAGSIEETARPN